MTQIEIVCPVEISGLPFMQIPEYVGGDGIDASGLHFQNFLFPVGLGEAGIVKFSDDGIEGASVFFDVVTVNPNGIALGIGSAQVEVSPLNAFSLVLQGQRVTVLRLEGEPPGEEQRNKKFIHVVVFLGLSGGFINIGLPYGPFFFFE